MWRKKKPTASKTSTFSTEHLFLAILTETRTAMARILKDASVTKERVMEIIRSFAVVSVSPIRRPRAVTAHWKNTAAT